MYRIPFLLLLLLLLALPGFAQEQDSTIELIVRVDDMGFSHAANVGIMETFTEGIATSVEVMVPGPWFEEAAAMLRAHPEIDAGIHLVLTSEWSYLKWRPLTHAPGLTDEDGYFHPFIWPNDKQATFLLTDDWTLAEVEQELRAQIELAKRKIPQLSHLSGHMGCNQLSQEVQQLVERLAQEYGLAIFPSQLGFHYLAFAKWPFQDAESFGAQFHDNLRSLQPGKYLLVEHPAILGAEMSAVTHEDYENVNEHRATVTALLTSPETKAILQEKGIRLVSY
ncbi:MAG: ChbG/HpnK family deacetylase, partial [Bacteroidota bacterium]